MNTHLQWNNRLLSADRNGVLLGAALLRFEQSSEVYFADSAAVAVVLEMR